MTPLETILRAEEGCRLASYIDSRGFKTIGWGHKVKPDEDIPDPMTMAQANQLLSDDMDDAESDLTDALPWVDTLSPNRQAILGSMTFQMGINGVLEFVQMIGALRTQNWQLAHDAMLDSLWAQQTPARAQRHAEVILTNVLPEFYT